jgi:sugar (pentulose or hexulose) kinase
MAKDLIVGLDIGTSSIKLVVLDQKTRTVQLELVRSTQSARVNLAEKNHFDEQNVDILIEILFEIFKQIPNEFHNSLKAIQLCGQV